MNHKCNLLIKGMIANESIRVHKPTWTWSFDHYHLLHIDIATLFTIHDRRDVVDVLPQRFTVYNHYNDDRAWIIKRLKEFNESQD